MDTNQKLLKFKVWNLEAGYAISMHTKVKYARAMKKKLIQQGLNPNVLRIVYFETKHPPYKYLSIARVHQSIFGY